MKRGEPLKANPETTRAWKQRSAAKAAQNRRERASAPESRPTAQRAVRGRLAGDPEPSGKQAADRRARRAVRKRSGGRCEVRIPGVCRGQATNFHHRQPRGMGGTSTLDTAENYLHICGSGTTGCHGWIESNRDEARRRGWLVPHPTDPAAVPWSPHDEETP